MRMPTRDCVQHVLLGCVTLFVCSQLIAQQTTEAPPSPAQDSLYTIKSHVNVVLVPVLARDRSGQEVGNLKKEDFQVFDNGKPRVISGFTVQRRVAIESSPKPVPSAPAVAGGPPKSVLVPSRFVVFLFDDMHLSFEDLAQAQKASVKMLATSLVETDMAAVVSISGRINSGLTFDGSKLQAAIAQLKPQGLYRKIGGECPNIDYYQADLIQNKRDDGALQAAIEDVMGCSGLKEQGMAERLAQQTASQVLAGGDRFDIQQSAHPFD